MITVTCHSNSITIEGHAGYAPRGQDIVCAAVSTLVQTLMQSLEYLCTDEISYHLKPGWVEIKHGTLTKDAQLLLKSFFIGIDMIANDYPENVKLTNALKSIKAMEQTDKQKS